MPATLVESPRLVLRRIGSGTSLAGPMSARISTWSRRRRSPPPPGGEVEEPTGQGRDPGI